jgi:hypothetical protein
MSNSARLGLDSKIIHALSGVDHFVADAGVLRSVRDKPPQHAGADALGFLRVLADDRDVFESGRCCIAKSSFHPALGGEVVDEELLGTGEAKAATHGAYPQQPFSCIGGHFTDP